MIVVAFASACVLHALGSRPSLAALVRAAKPDHTLVVAAQRTGGRAVPDALAHPVSSILLAYLTLRSLREHRRGTLQWKARSVLAREEPARA